MQLVEENRRGRKYHKKIPNDKTKTSAKTYWTRKYSDVQNTADTQNNRNIISDLLSSEVIVCTRILVENVPKISVNHRNVITNLLRKELNEHISIQDIVVHSGKWLITFNQSSDALKAHKKLNGFVFRNQKLTVKLYYQNETMDGISNSCSPPNKLMKQYLSDPNTDHSSRDTIVKSSWSPTEREMIDLFEKELIPLLKKNTFLQYHEAITTVCDILSSKELCSYFIIDALSQWSSGFIRIFHRTIKVIANTICLASSHHYIQSVRDSAKEGSCSVQRESWEPFMPNEIQSSVELKQYMRAFLHHFGPQHIHVDIPIRILSESLGGNWPNVAHELAHLVKNISAEFVIINHVIYLSSFERHYEDIVDNLAAYQNDSEDENQENNSSTIITHTPKAAKIVGFDMI